MGTKEKKVILFIVEGISDKVSLQEIFENYFDPLLTQVDVVQGDITQKSLPSEIKANLNKKIQAFCDIEKIRPKDIRQVFQIVDTDGAFISDNNVIQTTGNETVYTLDAILAKNQKSIQERNKNKASVLNILSKIKEITVTSGNSNVKISYAIYYFSRNLEHVLHNNSGNLTDEQKKELSNEFDDSYCGDVEKFKLFINDAAFAVVGSYSDSWDFIKRDTNSLKRFSNLHLVFKMF